MGATGLDVYKRVEDGVDGLTEADYQHRETDCIQLIDSL